MTLPSKRILSTRSRQRPARIYTLSQVQGCVEQLLAAQAAESGAIQLKTPAMQTLKLWSQQGMFQAATSLEEAAQFVMIQVAAAPGRYSSTVKPKAANRNFPDRVSDLGHHKSSLMNPSTPAALPDSAVHIELLGHLLASCEEIKNRMAESDRINNMVYSELVSIKKRLDQHDLQSISADAGKSEDSEVAERTAVINRELIRAINQLDGIGRHAMVSLDREVQAIRSGPQANKSQDGVSPLDVQRILARISNVEQNTIRIVQHLDGKLEQ